MKSKKLYVSMLILVIAFLFFMYILKIWFPEQFVMAIENERIIKIGNYIDSHKILYYICCGISAFATYWLYLCAVSHRLYLKWYECLYVAIAVLVSILCSIYDPTLYIIVNWTSFVILPALCKGDMKSCAIVLTTHALAQMFSLRIRNFTLYFTNNITFITSLLMTLESYLWLVLMYIIFNIKIVKKGEK